MKVVLIKAAWLLGALLCMVAGGAVFIHGCPDELQKSGLSLFHFLALLCCAGCSAHCLKEFMR